MSMKMSRHEHAVESESIVIGLTARVNRETANGQRMTPESAHAIKMLTAIAQVHATLATIGADVHAAPRCNPYAFNQEAGA